MEYFIIDEGTMWGRILDVLERKAKQGVDVRVMYDGMCELSTLSFDYDERLVELGIKAKAFSPVCTGRGKSSRPHSAAVVVTIWLLHRRSVISFPTDRYFSS